MTVSSSAQGLRALPDWSAVPSNSEDDRLFMNLRLAFYGQVMCALNLVFYLWNMLLATRGGMSVAAYLSDAETLLHLSVTTLFGVLWLIGRGGKRSARALNVLDVVSLPGVMCVYATMTLRSAQERDQTLVLMMITIMNVIIHAVVVPGTARRTFWLSIAACAPPIAATYSVMRLASPEVRWSSTAYNAMWAAVSVATASLTSRIIYGLSQRVREASELGQYTLEEKIGEGGMGVVYRARHTLLRRPTAVKLLAPDRAGERDVRRFEREVQLTSSLTHPNTIAVYDYGHTPDGVFYYAMEYLDGITLEDLVAHDGPQHAGRVARLLAQVCGALHEAHGIGLIHRDIKPANIMLCVRGATPDQVKVLDFGLVKETATVDDASVPALAGAAVLIGTPMYMAPEAIMRPESIDARADLYSLGAVCYHLLAGVPVFEASTMIEICAKQLNEVPTPPSARTTQAIPPALEKLVLSCLAKDPEERPRSAAAVLESLALLTDLPPWSTTDASTWWDERAAKIRAAVHTKRMAGATPGPRTVAVALPGRT